MESIDHSSICKEIRLALPNTSEDNIRNFLREILVYIDAMKRRKHIRPTNKEVLYEIDRVQKNVHKWIRTLDEMISCQHYLSDIYGGIDDLAKIRLGKMEDSPLAVKGKEILVLQHESFKAKDALQNILNSLNKFKQEFPPQSPGRPKADEGGFIAALAVAYSEFIGEPSTYPDGPFAAIVRIALEEVGLSYTDPTRKIKAAISSLDNTEK